MNDLRAELDALEPDLYAYVMRRAHTNSDAAAYKGIISRASFFRIDESIRARLNELAGMLKKDSALQAHLELSGAVYKAVTVKIDGLDSRDPRIRQAAASEILDRTIGKPITRADITSGGQPLKGYVTLSPDDWDEDGTE